jgi:hypothetical protein
MGITAVPNVGSGRGRKMSNRGEAGYRFDAASYRLAEMKPPSSKPTTLVVGT